MITRRSLLILLFLLTVIPHLFAQRNLEQIRIVGNIDNSGISTDPEDYYDKFIRGDYVVVGAFEFIKNVMAYVTTLRQSGYNARYGFNPMSRLFYVFVFKTDVIEEARNIRDGVRVLDGFRDAWVYSISKKDAKQMSKAIRKNPPELEIIESVVEEEYLNEDDEIVQIENDDSNEYEIKGFVTEDDEEGNDSETFKKLEKTEVGKFVVFDNILFEKNSSVVDFSSKSILDDIYAWMANNNGIKIKIHGHTNGKFRGEMYVPGRHGINRFFQMKYALKKSDANEVMLSQERAKTVKDYLVSRGISKHRVLIKGWGKKKMLYTKKSDNSQLNRRVEIEVVANK